MSQRRFFAAVLLAFPGVLLAHILAYGWVDSFALAGGVGHGYLPTTVPVVALLGTLSFLWLAVTGVRSAGSQAHPPVHLLLALQVVLFAGQEVGENLFAGQGLLSLAGSPALWLGLVLQLPIALLLVGLVRLGRRVAAFFLTETSVVPASVNPVWTPSHLILVRSLSLVPVGLRGPPVTA
jgi:hypothetical protein